MSPLTRSQTRSMESGGPNDAAAAVGEKERADRRRATKSTAQRKPAGHGDGAKEDRLTEEGRASLDETSSPTSAHVAAPAKGEQPAKGSTLGLSDQDCAEMLAQCSTDLCDYYYFAPSLGGILPTPGIDELCGFDTLASTASAAAQAVSQLEDESTCNLPLWPVDAPSTASLCMAVVVVNPKGECAPITCAPTEYKKLRAMQVSLPKVVFT